MSSHDDPRPNRLIAFKKSLLGRGFLKITGSMNLLLAFIFGQQYRSNSPPHLLFFFVVVFTGFVLLSLFYIIFAFSLNKRFNRINWDCLDVFVSFCLLVLLSTSSGLVAREVDFSGLQWSYASLVYERLVAAVVLAFSVVLILIISILGSLFKSRPLRRTQEVEEQNVEAENDQKL